MKRNHDQRKAGAKRNDPTAIAELYRKFIFYKNCFALEKPLIVCDGKTDIIYLQSALKNLEVYYPSLIAKIDKKHVYNIKFFKMSENMKEVFGIADGSSGLCALNDMFSDYIKQFIGQGKKHPVIILVDNDDGAKEIKARLKEKELVNEFYYRGDNLYIVPTPLNKYGKNSMIEDLFDKSTLSVELGGKKFNPGKKINIKTEYGKVPFAEKVIKASWVSLNFQGFKALLDRIDKVLHHYATEAKKS